MRFSIIVMTYKSFENLEKNLCSISAQTFRDYEVIIADDGSANYEESFVRGCIQKANLADKAQILHAKENQGTVRNYTGAIMQAKGEIIVPLSQDDVFYDEEVLSDLSKFFEGNDARAVCSKRSFEGKKTLPTQSEIDLLAQDDIEKAYRALIYRNLIYGATFYFRKDLWLEVGGFDTDYRLLEDHPFAIKLLSKGISIAIFDRITILYGQGGVSSGKVVHTRVGLPLIKDNMTLYRKVILPETKKFRSRKVARAYRYRWMVSFYCYENPKAVLWRKLSTYLKYPEIAVLRMINKKKYGEDMEAVLAKKLLQIEEDHKA